MGHPIAIFLYLAYLVKRYETHILTCLVVKVVGYFKLLSPSFVLLQFANFCAIQSLSDCRKDNSNFSDVEKFHFQDYELCNRFYVYLIIRCGTACSKL